MNPLAHRGWYVSDHAVDQFYNRVVLGSVSKSAIAVYLREHAHRATPTGVVTRRGQPVYRLPHPWLYPDAALVVRRDPDGTLAVVTCGWWEEAAA